MQRAPIFAAAVVLSAVYAARPNLLAAQQERVSSAEPAGGSTVAVSIVDEDAGENGDGFMQVPIGKKRRERIYRDPYNSDGSRKYSIFGGGAFTKPVGQTADSYATGFRFQGGAGRNFSRRLALSLQVDWDGLSVRNDVLNRLLPVYQAACGTVCTGSNLAEVFASSHVWSASVDPTYTFAGTVRRSAYAVVGAGFYHKVTVFSAPAASSSCNGCAQYPITEKFDSYTSNAPGWSAGLGAAQQIAHSDVHFYTEVRFVFVNNDPRPGNTTKLGAGFNAFPANSQPTYLLPVTLGFRF